MAKKLIQTVLTPLWRGTLVLVWLVSLPGSSSLGPKAATSEITLFVDVQKDSNEAGYQECDAAVDDCSLRGAITRANLDAGNAYIIQVPAGIYSLTLEGVLEDENQSGDLDISSKVSLVGGGVDTTIIYANQIDRVLDVMPGARVELRDISLQGGRTPNGATPGAAGEPGGGILNRGELTLRDTAIRDNRTGGGVDGAMDGDIWINCGDGGSGGGIYNLGKITMLDSSIMYNSAGDGGDGITYDWVGIEGGDGGSGGGIYNLGEITMVDSTITSNFAGKGGNGGEYVVCPDPTVPPPYVCYQVCTRAGDGGNGGGILNRGVLNIESSDILSNAIGQAGSPGYCNNSLNGWWASGSSGAGGGIDNQGRVDLRVSTIIGNEGGAGAGGLDNHSAAFLTDSTISDNRGDGGGGISNQLEAVLQRCTVEGNSGGNGGGIYNSRDLLLKESWIRDNDAAFGGGIYNQGSASVVDNQITHNITREGKSGSDEECIRLCLPPSIGESPSGGGVYNAADMTIDHSQVSHNSTGNGGSGGNGGYNFPGADGGAGGYGGGIYNSGSLELNMSSVDGNSAGNGGMGGESDYGYGDGNQGRGGSGGGIYNSGTVLINLGTLMGNRTGEGLYGGQGGGIANEGELTIVGGSVRDNLTIQDGNGGGIASSNPITISATTVISNTAAGSGGGFHIAGTTGQIANSILGHNQSGTLGSGLHSNGSMVNLENNSFAQNYGGDGSGLHVISSTLYLTNTILVSHTIGVVVDENSLLDMESTLWGSGIWANQLDWTGSGTIITGTNNYWDAPGFLDPAGLDYHILATSPAIDRGVNDVSDMDIDFQPRPNPASQLIDLGADEYWTAIPIETVSVTSQPTVTRTTPITLTATISPASATPNILYYWRPPPEEGQWTESAVYAWEWSGTETVTLMAINAASSVSETLAIIVEPVYSWIYLPVIGQ